jgi:hypothetical protein
MTALEVLQSAHHHAMQLQIGGVFGLPELLRWKTQVRLALLKQRHLNKPGGTFSTLAQHDLTSQVEQLRTEIMYVITMSL